MGQLIRLNRLVDSRRKCVIAALDAGGFFGPYQGLSDIEKASGQLSEADAILIEPGSIYTCKKVFLGSSPPLLITRLNWNTDYCFQWNYNKSKIVKSLSPYQAIAMGAEAGIASLSINTGDEDNDAANVGLFTEILEEAMQVGLPIIGEIYPPRKKYKKGEFENLILKSARIAMELGANAIKTFYIEEIFKDLTGSLAVPVFALGGEKKDTELEALETAEKSVKDGARGVVYGRNLYQSSNPASFLKALKDVVNSRLNARDAAEKYGLR